MKNDRPASRKDTSELKQKRTTKPSQVGSTGEVTRSRILLTAVAQLATQHFDSEGKWRTSSPAPGFRERKWYALVLLAGGSEETKLANRILESSQDDGNDFVGFFSPLILRLHRAQLSKAATEVLESSWQKILPRANAHLHRYTENCGLMNACGLIEAAHRFDRPDLRARAIFFLEHFLHFLETNGALREYFSLNYLPVTAFGAAAIRHLSPDPEGRNLAQKIEKHIWMELARVWHPGLRHPAGPSARSYTYDSMGAFSHIHIMAWLGVGDPCCPSPDALGFFESPEACGLLPEDWAFHQIHAAIYATVPYRVPTSARRLLEGKSFPFSFESHTTVAPYRLFDETAGMAEAEVKAMGGWCVAGALTASGSEPGRGFLPSQLLQPRGRTGLAIYQEATFGLGTATLQMCGQSDTCHAAWKVSGSKKRPLTQLRTLYFRGTVNTDLARNFRGSGYPSNVAEQWRGGALQSGPLAVLFNAANDEITEGITSLQTTALVSEWFSPVGEVRLNETRVTDDIIHGAADDWVFLRDGDSYIGLRPLLSERVEVARPLRVQRLGRFLSVSAISYEGKPRSFLPAALRQITSGMILLLGNKQSYPGGFRSFRAACARASISDELYESQRAFSVKLGEREISAIWDVQTEHLVLARTERGFLDS
jgi:hypothetical protein